MFEHVISQEYMLILTAVLMQILLGMVFEKYKKKACFVTQKHNGMQMCQ